MRGSLSSNVTDVGVAPSLALRTWFGHDPARWEEFRRFGELRLNLQEVERLVELVSVGKVTLLFAARDLAHNNAVALAEYLALILGIGA
jgi:uncharacterized protein YeaO (DUF488 family)